mmetsp:Transcript_26990/g.53887  ORF Transcript_26990/g.53887 Transcript_26990/m.53887 type:complete len:316 (-) Transcript_26990:2166-3113(-)
MKTKSAPQKRSSFTAIDIHLSRSDSSSNASSSSSLDELDKTKKRANDTFDAKAYLDNRVMSPLQEACNAITMIPQMVFSAYYVLSGSWAKGATEMAYYASNPIIQQQSNWLTHFLGDEYRWAENLGCIDHPMFPRLTALPPPAVMIIAMTGIVHPIFSILFHWYCMRLEPSKRIPHWSRRLDHAFIHFASACASYGTTGRIDYFLLNVAFNLDSAVKHFETKICPKRNVRRVGISILMYILPVLLHGHYLLFCKFLLMFILAGYSFSKYPIGGWSHTLFHAFLSFLPYLLFCEAVQLNSSQAQISLAAQCASGTA